MNNDSRNLVGLFSAITSGAGAVLGWQSQLEYWLRIMSLLIGIVAGLYTIYHYTRKHGHR